MKKYDIVCTRCGCAYSLFTDDRGAASCPRCGKETKLNKTLDGGTDGRLEKVMK